MEPHYTAAEHLYEVHGRHGEDPTDPPASADYAHPQVSHEPRIQQLSDDLEAAGYRPFHAPCGIRLDEARPAFSHCVRCIDCDGFPCLVHGKADGGLSAAGRVLSGAALVVGPPATPAPDGVEERGELLRRDRRRRAHDAVAGAASSAANSASNASSRSLWGKRKNTITAPSTTAMIPAR